MNRINFNQTGGFPLSTDILDEMQSAYSFLNSFSKTIGDNCIISGCEKIGQNITEGVVIINGELLPFRGSLFFLNANFAIREDVEERVFEDSNSKSVIFKRYVTLTSDKGIPFEDMDRITTIQQHKKALVPIGMISMWSGLIDSIPKGWALCDGKNGTPNLVDRFIVASGQKYKIGDTGGLDQVTLNISQMPEHSHTGTTNKKGEHKHEGYAAGPYTGLNIGGGFDGGNNSFKNRPFTTELSGDHAHELIIDQTGGSQPHENRPPYYALAFIIYKGE